MYQFVVGSGIPPPFTLWFSHPSRIVPFGSATVRPYRDSLLLVHKESDDSYDLSAIDAFYDPVVSINFNILFCIHYIIHYYRKAVAVMMREI
jgi:hypothetical protein